MSAVSLGAEPTVLYDMPENEYHSQRDSLSASGAKWLAPPNPCPAKFIWHRDNEETKDVFDFGHVVHRIVLGRGSDYKVLFADDGMPFENMLTKASRAAADSARGDGKVPILLTQLARAEAVAKAVADHPIAGPLFTEGKPEVSLFWTDQETGVVRRARLDWLRDPVEGRRLLIGDLKTAHSAEPTTFGKRAADFGYHISAANYVDGAIACGLDPDPAFLFVAVEKDPPYVVTVVQATDDDIQLGRHLMRAALRLYAKCTAEDHWPGYATDVVPLELPGYYINRIEAS